MISSGTIVACTGEPTQGLRTEGRKALKGETAHLAGQHISRQQLIVNLLKES
jgi:hypothetical protein